MKNISAGDRSLACGGMCHILCPANVLTHRAVLRVARKLESGGASHG